MASSFLEIVNENLKSLIKSKVGLLCGVDQEMKKISSTLSMIGAVLVDAEQKQLQDKAIQEYWLRFLRNLKDVTYELDDILDDCATEALRQKIKGQTSSSLKKVSIFLNFRHTVGNRMKHITQNLSAIAKEHNQFYLSEAVVGERDKFVRDKFVRSRESSSFLEQPYVYGRDEDKQKIVKVLVEDICDRDEVSVYPIIGMGGLGKTTLAQMAFNDVRVNSHFEPKLWVYVSQDFDVKRVIQETIESATGKASEMSDLDSLQRQLRDILNGKRYLIVLDDVWNDNQEKWNTLKSALACGSKGASIIITTRLDMVSSIMKTIPPHYLSSLPDNDCWLLFKQSAFGSGNQERQNLLDIGKEIVKKCGGVPLAAKALGGLLRFKSEEEEWNLINRCEVWRLPHDENSILPALRLSYDNLSWELKRCFAYCAVFSKGCKIEKENLIHLWMANGYIFYKEELEPEDIGNHIWKELYRRSFFQDADKQPSGNIVFTMHDLIHDLAQSVMGDECHMMWHGSSSCIPEKRIYHVTLLCDTMDKVVFPKSLLSVKSLRSILLQCRDPISLQYREPSDQFYCDFTKFPLLHAFDARVAKMVKLSSSIGNLKHLKFLNLAYSSIKELPKSICSLHNLQTLNLNHCRELRRLPKNMMRLRDLRHLYLEGCKKIHDMPPKLGQLTLLKTLSLFCVGKSGDQRLAELLHLDLGGELCIKHLERVRNSTDAEEANLVGKQKLRIIKYCWNRNVDWESEAEDNNDWESEVEANDYWESEADDDLESQEANDDWESQANVEQLLESLKPHQNVEELFIDHYKGAHLPLWMRDSTLKNVVTIKLFECRNCLLLPPFGQLPSLRCLEITGMDYVEYIDNDFPDGGPVREFPSLEELYISNLRNLKHLSREERRDLFPRLRKIEIDNCPRLTLPCLSSSETLTVDIYGCSNGTLSSISNLNRLTSLTICDNDDAISFPEEMLQNLTSLESLVIGEFRELKVLPTNLSSLVSLKSMEINGCDELKSLPEEGLRGLESLQLLEISSCAELSSLSEGLQHLTALEKLSISYCPKLVALPEGVKHLKSLRDLTLIGKDSAELKSLPESLQHVTSLQSLWICDYPELTSLPEWLGNFSSLQSLWIDDCPKIESLPQSIQSLTKLKSLHIVGCGTELYRRCQEGNGEDWYKIAHIPDVIVTQVTQVVSANSGATLTPPAKPKLKHHKRSKRFKRKREHLSGQEDDVNAEISKVELLREHEAQVLGFRSLDEYNLSTLDPKSREENDLERLHSPEVEVSHSYEEELLEDISFEECGETPSYPRELIDLKRDLMEVPPTSSNQETPSDPQELSDLNCDLMEVRPTLSHHFSILHELDLSYTEIKSLPSSISRLVALKKLSLRNCVLLMKIPPEIGELTNLEVLGLEGTEILCLPKEIAKLVNLTSLKVSFYGYANQTVIPRGVLSSLSRLNELIIDVTPYGEWWDVEVEAIINDLCSLKELRTLKFYFPTAELLEDLTLIFPGLASFRFTVGRHKEHFISPLPQNVEEEFNNREKLEKGLKYVDGNHVPYEITKVLKRANAFVLQRHWTAESLSDFGHENMDEVKFCLVMECNEFRTIIDYAKYGRGSIVLGSLENLVIHYMKNMESICKGPVGIRSLTNLKSLALHTCPNLTTLFTGDMLINLTNLEELIVEDCPKIKSLVSLKSSGSESSLFLRSLKKISLLELPELVSISGGLRIAPNLERMVIFYCPKLEKLSTMEVSSTDLKVIKGEKEWWDALKWYESDLSAEHEDYLARLFIPLRRDGDLMAQITKD